MVRAAAKDRLPATVLRIGGAFSDWCELPPLYSLIKGWWGTSPLRRILVGRLMVLAALVVIEVVLESPLRAYLGVIADMLGTPLLPVSDEWLAFVVAPINSVAGLIGIVLLGLNVLYRRIVY